MTTLLQEESSWLVQPRAYQVEMFEQSMKGNVIVAMDTGSGKTQVALLRISEQLKSLPLNKRIWFLAPTVVLCTQQCHTIRSYFPAIHTILLVGSDGVDCWSTQGVWDTVLQNAQIVVSTHAILAGALGHGFVRLGDLPLLIVDEAHHCVGGHPSNVIMQNTYHWIKRRQQQQQEQLIDAALPSILGLSASPIVRSRVSELLTIEANLDSRCITPRVNRQELMRHVHRPRLERILYVPSDPGVSQQFGPVLQELLRITRPLPYQSAAIADAASSSQLVSSWQGRTEMLEKQLGKFCAKAIHVHSELGSWAADHFVFESVAALARKGNDETWRSLSGGVEARKSLLTILDVDKLTGLHQANKLNVAFGASHKLRQLLAFLKSLDPRLCSGLIFVQQRAVAGVLCTLLSTHTETSKRFQCATFVGTSNFASSRIGLAELLDIKTQDETLSQFRSRKKNLIISTSVLEEGIDVAACNVVLCFDPPANVKSYIQRRGRARQEASRFLMMLPSSGSSSKIDMWESLENEMTSLYMTEERAIRDAERIEYGDEENVPGELYVESTQARITPYSAGSHVRHFCDKLPHEPYVDHTPVISFSENDSTGLLTGTIHLPMCLTPCVRRTSGLREWRTERAATKDAFMQTYIALHEAGLLSDHLLPLSDSWSVCEELGPLDVQIFSEIGPQFDPWKKLAAAWSTGDIRQTEIRVSLVDSIADQDSHQDQTQDLCMVLTAPSVMSLPPITTLHWDYHTKYRARCHSSRSVLLSGEGSIDTLRRTTLLISRSGRSDRSTIDQTDFALFVSPKLAKEQLSSWYDMSSQQHTASQSCAEYVKPPGLVRPLTTGQNPHIFQSWSRHVDLRQSIKVLCSPLTKRRNFLEPGHKSTTAPSEANQAHRASELNKFSIEDCVFDQLPLEYVRFGLFLPSLLLRSHDMMIAEELYLTVLDEVRFNNIEHVVSAITAPSAGRSVHYQRYEFIGDAVLKFIVSHQLYCDHEAWHEGYLTRYKSWLVSNQQLAKAALDKGLDHYIITESVRMKKWKIPCISSTIMNTGDSRQVSRKVLADVVESLIGAAYVDGGLNLARGCLRVFLPWVSPGVQPVSLPPPMVEDTRLVAMAEKLIGYTFKNKALLLQSLTHPSSSSNAKSESYQRLKFLGDAVLDMIVVRKLASSSAATSRSPGNMTLIKAALVNASFLGFLCIEHHIDIEDVGGVDKTSHDQSIGRVMTLKLRLSDLLQHTHEAIVRSQERCLERYKMHRDPIHQALWQEDSYPWLPLARLNPDKLHSDLVEAIIGAIFEDSAHHLEPCEGFVARLGLFSYMDRLLMGGIDLRHPKSILGQLAGAGKVSYSTHRTVVEQLAADVESYTCRATVDELIVAESRDCHSKEEATLVAAITAASVIVQARKRAGP